MFNFPAFIDLKKLSENQIFKLFEKAQSLEKDNSALKEHFPPVALLFFEPSTRTRMSFEMACGRLGLSSILLSGKSGTSLEKGESLEDTVLNVAAMKPSLMIVRAQDDLPMDSISQQVKTPWINAGWGKKGHPTQALLDALTIYKFRGQLSKERVLLVGDVRHSRVVASHLELAKALNYQVGCCGPQEFLFETESRVQSFHSLEEGLRWATVVMALRVQNERHDTQHDLFSYHTTWGLNAKTLANLDQQSLILHPGPVNHGVEIDSQVFHDPRCRILEQVTQGVFLRQALISTLLKNPGDLA